MADFEELEKRLRIEQSSCQDMADTSRNDLQDEAADAIRQLRQERDEARGVIAELKQALRSYTCDCAETLPEGVTACNGDVAEIWCGNRARAALARFEKEPKRTEPMEAISSCVGPDGRPFSPHVVDRRWARRMIAERDATIAELIEALRPFADEAEGFSLHQDSSAHPWFRDDEDYYPNFTIGDLRRARAALARLEKEGL